MVAGIDAIDYFYLMDKSNRKKRTVKPKSGNILPHKPSRARGQKSKIKEHLNEICDLLASGVPISKLRDYGYEHHTNIYLAMARDPEIGAAIDKAREAAQDYEMDLCIDIADAAKTAEEAQVAKLRIWARQWRAANLAPRKYGNKTRTEITGADGGALSVTIRREDSDL